ncbi:hypothetical protein HZS_4716, partial [Henneguya salminicola]
MNQHSHGSDAVPLQVAKIMGGIKRRATETTQIPSVILNGALQQTSTAVLAKMPNKDAIRKVIQRRPREWSHLIEKLYVDGTFSLAPTFFSQIYVIMAARGEFLRPVLYALIPNKEGRTYRRLFEAIKELWPNLNPSSISIDFEQAAIGAIRTTFPNCAIHGCLFHLTKNMRRKLSDEGLLRRYNTDHDFALAARMIVTLSFFEDVYIERQNRNRTRRSALFPPHMWSVYERTVNGEDRTNNYVEAAHRSPDRLTACSRVRYDLIKTFDMKNQSSLLVSFLL